MSFVKKIAQRPIIFWMDGSGRIFRDRMKIEDMQTNTNMAYLTQLQLTSPTRSALSSFLSTMVVVEVAAVEEKKNGGPHLFSSERELDVLGEEARKSCYIDGIMHAHYLIFFSEKYLSQQNTAVSKCVCIKFVQN